MKKYTKEIASLLTLVTAGIIGGSVYAADAPDTPTAGVPLMSRTEETETPEVGESVQTTPVTTPVVGSMPVTSCSDKYCEETENTAVMGLMMPPDTTPPQSTVTTPPDTTTVTSSTTPFIGTIVDNTTTTVPQVTTPHHTTTVTSSTTPFIGTIVNDTTTTKPPVTPGSTVPFTTPQKKATVRGGGDVDGSGVTDLSDLIKLSMYLLKDIDLEDSSLIEADINKDGKVDITDLPALKIKIMTPEKITPVPGTTTTVISIPDTTTTVKTIPDTATTVITIPDTATTAEAIPDTTTTPQIPLITSVTNNPYARMWLSQEPDKTEYKIGEELDLSGALVSASGQAPQGPCWDIFSHQIKLDDTMVKVDASSFNNKVPGSYTIYISYGTGYQSCSTSFTVTVTK